VVTLIALDQVVKRYAGGYEALRGLTLDVRRGEFLVVTGHSGAGKSTLLKIMAAVERPTSGSVRVGGQDLARVASRAVPYLRRNFGVVFQDHKLLFDRSVFENVVLPLRIQGWDSRDAAKRVRAALDTVGLLDHERVNPAGLSGGEQQRVCIARAIVHRPAIILADEPTANLDASYVQQIVNLLGSLHQAGATVVVATHDPESFARVAGGAVQLHQGAIAA
jgi:cell division transport system ATP-binding protein